MADHPILIPFGGTVAVRWLRAQVGRCYARDFLDTHPECKKSLLALCGQFAAKGAVGKVPENGHKLKGDYSDLWVLKPADYRFMGFRHRRDFFLTNGAPKKSPTEQQEEDYRLALKLRVEFFLHLDD